MTVRMAHPDLPLTQVIEVEDLAAPHYRASGWTDAPEVEETPAPDPKDSEGPAQYGGTESGSVPAADPEAPKQRRTTTKKESDQR